MIDRQPNQFSMPTQTQVAPEPDTEFVEANFTLTFAASELNSLMQVLSGGPYGQVKPLVDKIRDQVRAQQPR